MKYTRLLKLALTLTLITIFKWSDASAQYVGTRGIIVANAYMDSVLQARRDSGYFFYARLDTSGLVAGKIIIYNGTYWVLIDTSVIGGATGGSTPMTGSAIRDSLNVSDRSFSSKFTFTSDLTVPTGDLILGNPTTQQGFLDIYDGAGGQYITLVTLNQSGNRIFYFPIASSSPETLATQGYARLYGGEGGGAMTGEAITDTLNNAERTITQEWIFDDTLFVHPMFMVGEADNITGTIRFFRENGFSYADLAALPQTYNTVFYLPNGAGAADTIATRAYARTQGSGTMTGTQITDSLNVAARSITRPLTLDSGLIMGSTQFIRSYDGALWLYPYNGYIEVTSPTSATRLRMYNADLSAYVLLYITGTQAGLAFDTDVTEFYFSNVIDSVTVGPVLVARDTLKVRKGILWPNGTYQSTATSIDSVSAAYMADTLRMRMIANDAENSTILYQTSSTEVTGLVPRGTHFSVVDGGVNPDTLEIIGGVGGSSTAVDTLMGKYTDETGIRSSRWEIPVFDSTQNKWVVKTTIPLDTANYGAARADTTYYPYVNADGEFALSKSIVVQDKGGQVYNVTAFGVIPNDGFNDSTGVAQAIAAAIATSADTGAVVFFPPGTFEANIILPSGVTLQGSGVEKTIIKSRGGSNRDVIQGQNFFTYTGTDSFGGTIDWEIRDMTIDGNKAANADSGYGIRIYGKRFRLYDVRVQNCRKDGIWTEWNGTASYTAPWKDQEPWVSNIKTIFNEGDGWQNEGPGDMEISGLISYENGHWGLNNNAPLAIGSYNGYLNDSGAVVTMAAIRGHNFVATTAAGHGLLIRDPAGGCNISSGEFTGPIGIEVQSPNHIIQGLVTNTTSSAVKINGGCGSFLLQMGTNSGYWFDFTSKNGRNVIITQNQGGTSGTLFNGTPNATDVFQLAGVPSSYTNGWNWIAPSQKFYVAGWTPVIPATNDTLLANTTLKQRADSIYSDGGFNAPITDRGGQVYNVLAYGADPTETSDSRSAINTTISTASAAGGGVVYFPPGTYKVTATAHQDTLLKLRPNVTLKGAGQDITIIRIASSAYQYQSFIGGVGQMQNITIENLTLDHNADVDIPDSASIANPTAGRQHFTVCVYLADNLIVRGVRIRDFTNVNSLYFNGSYARVSIVDNRFTGVGLNATNFYIDHSTIYVHGVDSSIVDISRNVFEAVYQNAKSTNAAIETHASNLTVQGNIVQDYFGGMNIASIYGGPIHNVLVGPNEIRTLRMGIAIWADTTSLGNATGLSVDGLTIRGNKIQLNQTAYTGYGDRTLTGISINQSGTGNLRSVVIDNNTVTFEKEWADASYTAQTADIGIGYVASTVRRITDCSVTNNKVYNAPIAGIRFASALVYNLHIANNDIVDAGHSQDAGTAQWYRYPIFIHADTLFNTVIENNYVMDTWATTRITYACYLYSTNGYPSPILRNNFYGYKGSGFSGPYELTKVIPYIYGDVTQKWGSPGSGQSIRGGSEIYCISDSTWRSYQITGTTVYTGRVASGTATFSTTDARVAVYIPGATSSDLYWLQPKSPDGTTAPVINDLCFAYPKTDSLVVIRGTGGTSGLSVFWQRMK